VSQPRVVLTAQQDAAIIALLSCPTIKAAARKAKVAESTLYVWLKTPLFRDEYRRSRQLVVSQALGVLGSATKDAVATLKRNLKCKEPGVEVRAAIGILDKAINGQAMADLQAEIEELRGMLEQLDAESRESENAGESTAGATGRGPESAGEGGPTTAPGADPPGDRPGDGAQEGGDDARPVAGGVPREPDRPADAPLLPAEREDDGGGGADTLPLFDAP
jgi:transposase-like protein